MYHGLERFLRSVRADIRRADRESKRYQRELERQEKLERKLAEQEQAAGIPCDSGYG